MTIKRSLGAKSLFVVTRPKDQAAATAAALTGLGYDVLIEPMLDIVTLDAPLPPLDRFGALVFSSANAVRAFAERELERNHPAYAVGGATEQALRRAGFSDVRVAAGDAEALADLIGATYGDSRPALHLSGRVVARELGPLLASAGVNVERVAIYDAVAAGRLSDALVEALYARTVTGVLFFSARTAEIFGTLIGKSGLQAMTAGIKALCLSADVAQKAGAMTWMGIEVAARPTVDALLAIAPPWPGLAQGAEDSFSLKDFSSNG